MNEDEQRQQAIQQLKHLIRELDEVNKLYKTLAAQLQNMQLFELLQRIAHPKRIIWMNLIAGISRGIGLTVGTALLLTLAGIVLGRFISLPLIGEYIANLLDIVESYRLLPE